jgi:hypothetical protein
MGSPAGAIYDTQAVQSCNLAGIALMKGKIVKLQQLQQSIEANWRECEKARSAAELNNAVLLSLKLVKASCDSFLGIAEDITSGTPIGIAAKRINAAYNGVDQFATIAGKKIAGEKVGGAEWTKASNAAASNAFKFVVPQHELDDLVSLQKIKTDIIVDAVAQDEKSIAKDMQSYGWKLGEMTAKAIDKGIDQASKKVWGRFVKVGKQLVGASQKMWKAYEDWKHDDMNASLEGIKRSFKAQHMHVQQQIDALVKAIADCELVLRLT